MKDFAQLKQNVRDRLWPSGDPENLAAVHDKMVVEALIEIQQLIECFQYNNSQLVPACGTLFQSGMTVFDAPRGRIRAVHAVDRVDANGVEDISKPRDWAGRVFYRNVSYPDLERTALGPQPASCTTLWNNLRMNCGLLQKKFPTPTDEDYGGENKLPLGHHFSQASTDSSYGRSLQGVWAQHRGRIYTFPWIQSTETLLIEWDGIKRTFEDDDLIDEDPMLELAVILYVERSHTELYDADYDRVQVIEGRYREALARLRHECREETRVKERERSHARQQNSSYSIGKGPVDVDEVDNSLVDGSKLQSGCPAVTPPIFWPASGAPVLFPTEVALQTSVTGATIHYTANGDTPTADSPTYSIPLTVVDGMTIKAVAVDSAGCVSPVVYSAYSKFSDSSEFYRRCTVDDKSGPWHEFEADGGDDWNWRLNLGISESTEIRHVEVYQTDADGVWTTGQAWSTKLEVTPPNSTESFLAYPLVIYSGGSQINYSYVDSLGFFTSSVEWDLYGDTVSADLTDQHYLLRIYTDSEDGKPVEMLMDGTPCGKVCCDGRCGTQTLDDELLSIAISRESTSNTCVLSGDYDTGGADCILPSLKMVSSGKSVVTITVGGVEMNATWRLVTEGGSSYWTLDTLDPTDSGDTVVADGWSSSTDSVNTSSGQPEGGGVVYMTVNGVSYNVQFAINGSSTCSTTSTTTTVPTTSTTTTASTTSTTTTPAPPLSCQDVGDNWIVFNTNMTDGNNIVSHALAATVSYYDPATENTEVVSLVDDDESQSYAFCWTPPDGVTEWTIELQLVFAGSYTGPAPDFFLQEESDSVTFVIENDTPSGTYSGCMSYDDGGGGTYIMTEC